MNLCFSVMTQFRVFSDLEFPRRGLTAPDAATAGNSSPRLCVDSAFRGLILPFDELLE